MAAPSTIDGIKRAIREIAMPSIVILGAVVMIRESYGKQEAGLMYIGLETLTLLMIYTSAKYWNFRYATGFSIAGLILWFGVPGFAPQLVPSQYTTLGSLIALVFLILIAMMLKSKFSS